MKQRIILIISIILISIIICLMLFTDNISSITITPIQSDIIEQSTYQVQAQALDKNNKLLNKKLIYISTDTSIFIVDENGLITAINPGKALLYVKDEREKISSYIEITVKRKEILAEKLSFEQKEYTIKVDETINFNVIVKPDNADNKNYTVTANNNNVSINNNTITGKNIGETILTATLNNLSDTCTIKVLTNEIAVDSITLNTNKGTLTVDEKVTLKATISPSNATNKTVTWSSSDTKIATVNNGVVTAKAKGTCTITAKAGDKEDKYTLTVKEKNKLEIHMFKAEGYYDDCILIRDNTTNIFLDGGRGGNKVVEYLKELKITKLDAIMGSHLHDDHISAHTNILDNFTVKAAYYPDVLTSCRGCDDRSKKTAQRVNNKLYSKGITPKVITPGNNPQKVTIGDLEFYFLGPINLVGNTNENSSIVILKFGNNQFMFTGDAESNLIKYTDIENNAKKLGISFKVDVLKYPHHGNATLDGKFLRTINPKYVLVPNNGYSRGPTSASNIKSNTSAKIYCLNGQAGCDNSNVSKAVIVTSDGNTISIKNQ